MTSFEKPLITRMTSSFEEHVQQTEDGTEFWLARDLQKLLGYTEWRNFLNVINKAEEACSGSGEQRGYHFVDVNKMIDLDFDLIAMTRPNTPTSRFQKYHLTEAGKRLLQTSTHPSSC